jgi:ribosomal protein S3
VFQELYERTLKPVTITITTACPGIIIGVKGGQEVIVWKEELKKYLVRCPNQYPRDVKRPSLTLT